MKAKAKETGLKPWPADAVERWSLDRIRPYPQNARIHSERQIAQIAASFERFGVTAPVLVDEDGLLIYGHGRRAAAELLGYPELPVSIARGWTEAEKKAYRIADNQLGALSEFDMPLLQAEISELSFIGFDMPLLGFDAPQLKQFLAGQGGTADPEATPEPPKEPVVRRGDLWVLGDHRLLCADCTEAENVKHLLDGNVAQMAFLDPPYGVDYTGGMKPRERLSGDHIGTDIYHASLQHLSFALDDKAALYLWYADAHAAAAAAAAAAAGYQITAQIIWAKNHAQFVTSAHYKGKHEPCFYAHRRGKTVRWHGPNSEVTLWECARAPRNDWHPTQKPVELAERAIRNSSAIDDRVLDIFLGGGCTLIACEMTGRKALGMEIEPAYVQVAIERWQTFSGKEATLEDGRTLAEVAKERGKEKGVGKPPRTTKNAPTANSG